MFVQWFPRSLSRCSPRTIVEAHIKLIRRILTRCACLSSIRMYIYTENLLKKKKTKSILYFQYIHRSILFEYTMCHTIEYKGIKEALQNLIALILFHYRYICVSVVLFNSTFTISNCHHCPSTVYRKWRFFFFFSFHIMNMKQISLFVIIIRKGVRG